MPCMRAVYDLNVVVEIDMAQSEWRPARLTRMSEFMNRLPALRIHRTPRVHDVQQTIRYERARESIRVTSIVGKGQIGDEIGNFSAIPQVLQFLRSRRLGSRCPFRKRRP